MEHYYAPQITDKNQLFELNEEESYHIVNVMRYKIGSNLIIVDGKGNNYTVELYQIKNKKCIVNIIKKFTSKPQKPFIHVAISPTRKNDRFEWFLEKSTELGVSRITPIICDRTIRKKIKYERAKKIIISSFKQSKRKFIPLIDDITNFKEVRTKSSNSFIACCQNILKINLDIIPKNKKYYQFFIGPEGDFTESELNWAITNNIKPLSLGENRLRTETAGIMAVNFINLVNN